LPSQRIVDWQTLAGIVDEELVAGDMMLPHNWRQALLKLP
jgi:hypothetical protein